MRFEPGPGMDGHCLTVDPFYLIWRAREFHMSTEFMMAAAEPSLSIALAIAPRFPSGCQSERNRSGGVLFSSAVPPGAPDEPSTGNLWRSSRYFTVAFPATLIGFGHPIFAA